MNCGVLNLGAISPRARDEMKGNQGASGSKDEELNVGGCKNP